MKAEFYPRVRKAGCSRRATSPTQSGHSRGSTMDLTLVKLPARPSRSATTAATACATAAGRASKRFRDNTIDMGTGYDCFDPLAHPYARGIRGNVQRRNRLRLRSR